MAIRQRTRVSSVSLVVPPRVVTCPDLKVEYRPIGELIPAAHNPRTHSKKQLQRLVASLREFGFTNPILVGDDDGRVIAGHGRLLAAKQLGMTSVPVIRLSHLSEAQRRAYVIADNRLAELAGWDKELLAIELGELFEAEIAFDVEVTGFDLVDFERLAAVNDGPPTSADDVPPESEVVAVSRSGDLWSLGKHRLLCGDARETADLARLMDGESARLIFTDPPYNVKIDGHVSGLGGVRHREFAMASGEMTTDEFTSFLTTTLGNTVAVSTDGSIHFVCMDWRHLGELLAAGKTVYDELKNLCVWNKDNAGMGTFYRSKHELVLVFKKGRGKHLNTFGLGEGARYRTNVWDYPGANTLKPDRQDELAMHPTVKPVALVMDAIKDCSVRGDVILDAFGGSGTTLIAAHKTKRRARLIEFDPLYVDVIVRRWEKLSGETAVLADTGQSFAEIVAERSAPLTTEVGHG